MKNEFHKGVILTLGSFWWDGFTLNIPFIGHVELVIHRCLTAVMLIIHIIFLNGKFFTIYVVTVWFIFVWFINFYQLVNMDLCSCY